MLRVATADMLQSAKNTSCLPDLILLPCETEVVEWDSELHTAVKPLRETLYNERVKTRSKRCCHSQAR
jgi:hypothetical protein